MVEDDATPVAVVKGVDSSKVVGLLTGLLPNERLPGEGVLATDAISTLEEAIVALGAVPGRESKFCGV